jgi:hemolysin activation/secretion protein
MGKIPPCLGVQTGNRNMLLGCFFIALVGIVLSAARVNGADPETAFTIRSFSVEGNTLFPGVVLQEVLKEHLGPKKTAADVEKARNALEKYYHDRGYPAVLVNIPEQTVQEGTIRLQVIESKIGRIRVTGNRFVTEGKILEGLPSLAPGKVLYVPDVQRDLERINRGQDIRVSPVLSPGREPGTTDVDIKVEDKFPLHGSLELNNRGTHDTTDLRLNALLGYYNLWQRDHAFSVQYQMSPQDLDEVKALAFSYTLPNPWNVDHQVALYGILSDSETAFGAGFQTVGKGQIYGLRYVLPLPPYELYFHNLTLGVDYKDVEETLGFQSAGGEETKTPVKYLPFSLAYGSSVQGESGVTRFSAGLNMAFRQVITDKEQFETKRYQASGNYIYLTVGIERLQKLPAGMGFFLKLDGQISDQPLISNEQYATGGMQSVRGYKETEGLGDDAFHTTAELSAPDLGSLLGLGEFLQFTPYLFYDFAWLGVKEPLPGQDENIRLQGAGAGFRGALFKYFDYQADFAVALSETDRTPRNTTRFYFRLKFQF